MGGGMEGSGGEWREQGRGREGGKDEEGRERAPSKLSMLSLLTTGFGHKSTPSDRTEAYCPKLKLA